MSINRYDDLTDIHLDVLREIGNIGSGNASTALSGMINREVLIEMPVVKTVTFQEAVDIAGGAERLVAGVMSRMNGGVEGMLLLLMEQDFVNMTLSAFFGDEDNDILSLEDSKISAISEIGNIMGGAYVNAISTMTGMQIGLEAPKFQVDMLGALMSVPAIELGDISDKLIFIDKQIKIDKKSVKSNMMLIPTVKSLEQIMKKLGVSI